MKRVRILHFIDTLGAGGAERQLVYLLENLDRLRFDCHVLTTYDKFRHYESKLHQLDIPIYSLHHGELTALNRVGAVARYVQIMWSLRPHIVHSWLHYPNLIARVARPLCPPHRLLTAIRTEYRTRQRFSERSTMWLSNFRIVNRNSNTKTSPKTKTHYIPNSVFLPEKFPSPPNSSLFTILIVARIDPRKDHNTLLHALAQLSEETAQNIQTILIGEITDQQTQTRINNTINELNLRQHVKQLPPTHNIEPYYAQAHITILPSTTEGSPNVILESFASARPIIVSQAANRDGLVKHNINGWVFPAGDSKRLANLIETAYRIPRERREQMGLAGRIIAEQHSIRRMVEQYTQLYEHVLNRV